MNRIVAGYPIGSQAFKDQKAFTKLDFLKTQLLLKLLVLGAFIVILCLVYTWSRVQVVQLGYEINDIKQEEFHLKNENKKLKMVLALLKSPNRLETYAKEKMKMALPTQNQIIEIDHRE